MSGLFIMKPICCGECSIGNYDLTGLSGGGTLSWGFIPIYPACDATHMRIPRTGPLNSYLRKVKEVEIVRKPLLPVKSYCGPFML